MPPTTDVIVVGAGAAGLRVAERLHAHRLTVLVLEARDRVGGRLASTTVDGVPFDLGATWFWEGERRVSQLVERLGIGRFAQHLAGSAMYDHPQGAQRLADNPVDAPAWRIDGGAQGIAEGLAAMLPDGAIRLGCAVRSVSRQPSGVRIASDDFEACAARVVLALPPALALSRIEFDPPLPEHFASAARRTPVWMGAMTKVVAVYPEPFWRARGLAGAAFSLVGPMRELHDMSPLAGRPGALFGFMPLPARAVSHDDIRRQLGRLFGEAALTPTHLALLDWRAEAYTSPPGVADLGDHELFGHPAFAEALWDGRLRIASTETATVSPGHIEGALAAADHCLEGILRTGTR